MKWLRQADPPTARRLRNALRSVEAHTCPRSHGQGLTGPLAGLWRYRVGDDRIFCDILDGRLIILVIDLNHRSGLHED